MKAHETVLFDKCPLCSRGEIIIEKRGLFHFYKTDIKPCPSCSAEFAERGRDNYKLVYCEPCRLTSHHKCREHVLIDCHLGSTLSKSEWERIAVEGESSDLAKVAGSSARFQRGRLPTGPSEKLPFHLEDGEIMHYLSFPVYIDEQRISKQGDLDKGRLFLTSKRIVYESRSVAFTVQLENINQVDEVAPGFVVKENDSHVPHYFYPPRYDPVYAAVVGALRNLRRS